MSTSKNIASKISLLVSSSDTEISARMAKSELRTSICGGINKSLNEIQKKILQNVNQERNDGKRV